MWTGISRPLSWTWWSTLTKHWTSTWWSTLTKHWTLTKIHTGWYASRPWYFQEKKKLYEFTLTGMPHVLVCLCESYFPILFLTMCLCEFYHSNHVNVHTHGLHMMSLNCFCLLGRVCNMVCTQCVHIPRITKKPQNTVHAHTVCTCRNLTSFKYVMLCVP